MTERKSAALKTGALYVLLAASYVFKNLFYMGVTIAEMPYFYSYVDMEYIEPTAFIVVAIYIFYGAISAFVGVMATSFISTLLERNGRAFMKRNEFVFGVCIYLTIANAILGIIGLLYYLNALIYVFISQIASLIVYTAVFAVMFKNMRTRIPDYMVARSFYTMAVPYYAYYVVSFLFTVI